MKILVDYDKTGNLSAEEFDKVVTDLAEEHEVRIICRGIQGRFGDKYDDLRRVTEIPVTFTGGLMPSSVLMKEGWVPDWIIHSPVDPKESTIFRPKLRG